MFVFLLILGAVINHHKGLMHVKYTLVLSPNRVLGTYVYYFKTGVYFCDTFVRSNLASLQNGNMSQFAVTHFWLKSALTQSSREYDLVEACFLYDRGWPH